MKYLLFTILLVIALLPNCSAQVFNSPNDYTRKADSFYDNKDYRNAAAQYNLPLVKKKHKLNPYNTDSLDLYKAASANAHAGLLPNAFFYLDKWITRANLISCKTLLADLNFVSIRTNPRWKHSLDLIKGNKQEIEDKYGTSVSRELIDIRDQNIRQQYTIDSLVAIYGVKSLKVFVATRSARMNDTINLIKIRSIINAYGWLGPDIIGTAASQEMFDIVFNADFNINKKYVSIIWQAFLKGNASANNYAAIADKVSLIESGTQIYGSAVKRKGSSYYVPPILDEPDVNNRRAKIGLPPLSEYLIKFGISYVNL